MPMSDFAPDQGERVRIDIPDEMDPDHEMYHGKHGRVVEMLSDSADELTGDEADSLIYRIEFDDGSLADFRRADLRPPIETS